MHQNPDIILKLQSKSFMYMKISKYKQPHFHVLVEMDGTFIHRVVVMDNIRSPFSVFTQGSDGSCSFDGFHY